MYIKIIKEYKYNKPQIKKSFSTAFSQSDSEEFKKTMRILAKR